MTTGTTVHSIEGDTVDKICQRFYGRTAGITEQLLQHNPGLASKGTVLPTGTKLLLPEDATPPTKQTIQLWD
jgi:phage tail protein X